jgi:ABC-type transport system involved in cytochrome c biogenesis permease component
VIIGPVFRLTLRALMLQRRTILLGLLAAAPVLMAFVYAVAANAGDNHLEFYSHLVQELFVPTIGAVVALVIGVSALGDEREDGTIFYLVATPQSRVGLIATKIAAAWTATLILLVPSLVISALLILKGDTDLSSLAWPVAGLALATLATAASRRGFASNAPADRDRRPLRAALGGLDRHVRRLGVQALDRGVRRARSSPSACPRPPRRSLARLRPSSSWRRWRRSRAGSEHGPSCGSSSDQPSRVARAVQRHPKYTRDRIAQVGERIRSLIRADTRDPDSLRVAGPVDRIPFEEAERLGFRDAALGDRFGPLWATYWFRVEATVPAEWAGERVDLEWVSHSEATLWMGGRPVQGLNSSPDGARVDAPVLDSAAGGERLDLRVELACNGKFGKLPRPYASLEPVVLDRCRIARFDRRAWDLHHDFDVLRRLEADAVNGLDESWAGELLAELNRFCNVWVEDDRSTWDEGEAILKALLAHRNGSHVHELSAIGHAHIDTAWLWPLAETQRKMVRTFSSQTAYMDRYPEFRFACSQAQQYDWIRERSPDLYRRILAHAEAGRWVPVGGTWIEPDCNLQSGESLVRQFLHGQRFFERELGRRCREFWNPDVFGYNGQLRRSCAGPGSGGSSPRSSRGTGSTRRRTTLSCGRGSTAPRCSPTSRPPTPTTRPPRSRLRRSARTTRITTARVAACSSSATATAAAGRRPRCSRRSGRCAISRACRARAMVSSDGFFEALEAEAADLPTIVGELYFEYHRGRTRPGGGQAREPRVRAGAARRRPPGRARDAAFGCRAPRGRLAELWQLLLLNQFHDILPGSSIAPSTRTPPATTPT